jgi:hypothetical protein
MYRDSEHLKDLGVYIGQRGFAIAKAATQCDSCDVRPAPSDPSDRREWLLYEADLLGNPSRITGKISVRKSAISPASEAQIISRNEPLITRSDLTPVIGIPDHLLIPIYHKCSDEQRVFLCDNFVIAMCDVCRHSGFAELETPESIMLRYRKVQVRASAHGTSLAIDNMALSIEVLVRDELRYRGKLA